tara:strand:- start:172 stop:351 length:180 start_codon:yes stop_codon:yes gene_type:complete
MIGKILTHTGKISHKIVRQLTEGAFEKFSKQRQFETNRVINDFVEIVKELLKPPPPEKK